MGMALNVDRLWLLNLPKIIDGTFLSCPGVLPQRRTSGQVNVISVIKKLVVIKSIVDFGDMELKLDF